MDDLLAARFQMAASLAFHIIFAMVGMAMPLLMVLAERKWLKTGQPQYRELAKRWAKGTAILFAVGAVSGTVLSFELGLLWPGFMAFAGPVIGLPFALEGFAFFLEAIFLGIYLYGWDKASPKAHLFAGVMVALCGVMSGVFVVTVNAWMNAPTGFVLQDGMPTQIEPLKAMLNPAAFTQVSHTVVSAFQCVAFAVAGIHAWALLKRPNHSFHRKALAVTLPVAFITGLLQPLVGDLSAKMVAEYQPVKLAAMEAHWETERGASLRIGGWPDEEAEATHYSIDIPYALSFLAFADPNAEVLGLKEFPAEDRPPVAIVHIAFQIMVATGTLMMVTGALGLFLWWRRKQPPDQPWFLKLLVLNGPMGFIAMEAGWFVTEVGRQPWVIHGIMRTKDAVTTVPNLWFSFALFMALYLFLSWVVYRLLKQQVFATMTDPQDEED